MEMTYRIARADDLKVLTKLVDLAAGGIMDFLLQGVFGKNSAKKVFELALVDEESSLFYENFVLAEISDQVIGAANFYPSEQHRVSQMMEAYIPKDRIDHLFNYLNSRVDDSLYIHTLSVLPEYRKTLAAPEIFTYCEKLARSMNFNCLSAHVWRDNTPVYIALKHAGFEVVAEINIKPHRLLPHEGGMLLMRGQQLTQKVN
jgi:ribosomal protein S18 acetylase RimI-like enzyme